MDLDLLDKKIMYELDLNARSTSSQLAKKLHKNKETINFRLNRIISKNYLKEFYTIFNTSKLGWYYNKVFLKFKNVTPKKEKEIFDYITKQNHIAYLGDIEGYYDCIFLVMVKSSSNMIEFMNPFMESFGKFIQEKEIHTVLATHRLNEKFLFNGEEKKDFTYPVQLENYKLDAVEKKILNIISNNARIPLVEIAKQTGLDHKVVKYRLKKLEKDDVIKAYVSAPNFDKLGLQFTQINISLNDPSSAKPIINFFDSTNKCLFALELLGKYDLTIELHVENNEELKQIIDSFRSKFVNKYNDYDVSIVNKEHIVIWSPFESKKETESL